MTAQTTKNHKFSSLARISLPAIFIAFLTNAKLVVACNVYCMFAFVSRMRNLNHSVVVLIVHAVFWQVRIRVAFACCGPPPGCIFENCFW